MNVQIPLRPKNDAEFPQLKKIDKDIVAYAVLFGADNQTAFMRFHPEFMADSKTMNQAGKQASRQFWSWGKVKDYRQSYEETVEEFLNGKRRTAKSDAVSVGDGDISQEDIDKAMKALLRYVIDNSIKIDELDDPTFLLKVADKMRLFEQSEQKQISPIRVLLARCKSECNYCFFVETAKSKGLMFDSCDYCKARKIAEEHGFKFDHCTLLDVPQEVVKEIESHNDVKLTDILDNGQTTRTDIEKQFNELDTDEQDN